MTPPPAPGALAAPALSPVESAATAPHADDGEVRGKVFVPANAPFGRRLMAFLGPGLLVAVGYMDPGNWATDIEAGARFGYDLLFVVVASSLAAILLQTLAMRLGLVTGRDLAQTCRDRYARPTRLWLWFLAEVAIVACDIAEVLGAALAIKLLFGLPMWAGILITTLDLLLILGLKGAGVRTIEAIVLGLVALIGACFVAEMFFVKPALAGIAAGVVPSVAKLTQPGALYVAIGILGATVMPHNLYLHSSLVQTRRVASAVTGKTPERLHLPMTGAALTEALKLSRLDTVISLALAMFVNAALLILAAAAFHTPALIAEPPGLEDAYRLLEPLTGVVAASILFGLALLASGQSSTFTGTIAGQVILEGFLEIRWPLWLRRVITRVLAVVPALLGILWLGEDSVTRLLVLTQVVLSLQLPFAIYPLIRATSDKGAMGAHATKPWVAALAWGLFAAISGANLWLVWRTFFGGA